MNATHKLVELNCLLAELRRLAAPIQEPAVPSDRAKSKGTVVDDRD
jgi:hypothetical protein